jgi:signal-transduction protein with cAMP-binding, CBS, and nucleotidyltransferase domain
MFVRDVMHTDMVTASPETPISEVAKMMAGSNVGAVLIMDHGDLAGIVTDRDLVIKHLAVGHNRECPVKEAMTPERPIAGLVTIGPDMDILEAAQELGRRHVGRLPVREDGRLVGMLSAGDITHILHQSLDGLLAEGEKASNAAGPAPMGGPMA